MALIRRPKVEAPAPRMPSVVQQVAVHKEPAVQTGLTSITASAAVRITSDMAPTAIVARMAAQDMTRQYEAWDAFDLVGELHYCASTMGRRSSQAKMFIGKYPDDPTDGFGPSKVKGTDGNMEPDPVALRFLPFFRKFSRDLLYKGVVNLFIAGEFWVIGLPTARSRRGTDGEWLLATLQFTVFSKREVTASKNTLTINDGVVTKTFALDDVYAIRIANEHPMYRARVDSPVLGALPILREIRGLHDHVMAQIRSRLIAAGLFLIPSEASAALKAGMGEAADDDFDPLIEALADAMGTAIADPSNPEGAMPIMASVPKDTIEAFKLIDFFTKLDSEARNMRQDALARLGIALDIPPEVMTGNQGASHWSGWLSREDIVTTHLTPPIDLIMDGLTTTLLWPLMIQGGVKTDEAMTYMLGASVNDLIMRPNRAQDAKDLYGAGVLSDKAYRDAVGFDDRDAPEMSGPEMVVRMLFSAGRSSTAMFQNPENFVLIVREMARVLGMSDEFPEGTLEPDPVVTEAVDKADAAKNPPQSDVRGEQPTGPNGAQPLDRPSPDKHTKAEGPTPRTSRSAAAPNPDGKVRDSAGPNMPMK